MVDMVLLIVMISVLPCFGMDTEVITMHEEHASTASSLNINKDVPYYQGHALDAQNLSKFVSDRLPEEMQEIFVEQVHSVEWQKFATNFDKDSHQWYKGTMFVVNKPELLSSEEKNKLALQIIARALMYRCTTNNGHKIKKNKSMEKAQKYQKASIGSVIVGGIVTIVTNVLQHFLSKK